MENKMSEYNLTIFDLEEGKVYRDKGDHPNHYRRIDNEIQWIDPSDPDDEWEALNNNTREGSVDYVENPWGRRFKEVKPKKKWYAHMVKVRTFEGDYVNELTMYDQVLTQDRYTRFAELDREV